MENTLTISLSSCSRGVWLYDIIRYIELLNSDNLATEIKLILPEDIKVENFEPFHIVLLSCFLEHLNKQICSKITIYTEDDDVLDIIGDKIKIHKYFEDECPSNHEESEDSKILNLWKVVESETYAYSLSVSNYFKNNYFHDLDTSALSSALNEVYANIADHSQSDGNAFSYISYNPVQGKIHIAACDFGLGIATTLKRSNKVYESDSLALRDSLNIGVTAKSTMGNKGMGLDNILLLLVMKIILE